MELDEKYPKVHRNLMAQLRNLLALDAGLDPNQRETTATALNEIADHARDLDDIMNRLLNEKHLPQEIGELLIALELTLEQIRGYSDDVDGKLYEIGDRLKALATPRDSGMTPNPAAVALGKRRWAGTTKEERSEAMRRLTERRKEVEDPARRAEIMRKANEARWAKRRRRNRQ